MDQTLITRIVEAALLAASQPLTPVQLNALFPLDEPAPDGSIATALAELQAQCEGRGVELVEVASGWRYQVQADVHPWVARLWSERSTKYTRATLETLALIAYRQPITRGEIEQIRGVATNSSIIKALEEREWIRVVGHRDMPGKPELLGTTRTFLDYFGLNSLDALPPLSELKDFGDLEPQLDLGDAPLPTAAVALDEAGHVDAASDAATDPAGGDTPSTATDNTADASRDEHDATDAAPDSDEAASSHPPDTNNAAQADPQDAADSTDPTPAIADDGDSTRSSE